MFKPFKTPRLAGLKVNQWIIQQRFWGGIVQPIGWAANAPPQVIRRPWNAWSASFPHLIAAQCPGNTKSRKLQEAADASEESRSKMRSWRCLDGFDVFHSFLINISDIFRLSYPPFTTVDTSSEFWYYLAKTRFAKNHRLPWGRHWVISQAIYVHQAQAWMPGHSDGLGAQRVGWVDSRWLDIKRLSDKSHLGLANWTCTPGIAVIFFFWLTNLGGQYGSIVLSFSDFDPFLGRLRFILGIHSARSCRGVM